MSRRLAVLLVEDSRLLGERVAEAIQSLAEIDLVGIVDSEPAALTEIGQGSIDVVILDLHLRVGTGFGVMRGLGGYARRPQVLVFTNYNLPEYQSAAAALGATHVLDKARDLERIPLILEEILRSKQASLSACNVALDIGSLPA